MNRSSFPSGTSWSRHHRSNDTCPVVGSVGLLQDQLVQRQVGDGLPQSAVLQFEFFQPLNLIELQAAELIAPAMVGHLAHADRADRVGNALPLGGENINLPQLRNNLFRLVSLPLHLVHPPCCHQAYLGSDHFDGGGSVAARVADRDIADRVGGHSSSSR